MSSLFLSIITPSRLLEENVPVLEVRVPAYRGEIGILPGHAPLVTTLSEGTLFYKMEKTGLFKYIALSWGYLEVSPTGVTILAETAERAEEIEKNRAEKAFRESSLKLEQVTQLSPKEIELFQRRMRRAQGRIKTREMAFRK